VSVSAAQVAAALDLFAGLGDLTTRRMMGASASITAARSLRS
jgi:TfoX/Sxy family transcriptional regulator of competence genes